MNITRLLIANRGEIAVRIITTAKRLGIKTIAVYSTADEHALHVKLADSAYLIGDAPAQDSYLNINNILQAASSANADAIHPGYGFLAENPDFASRCESADIIFVGPSVEAINAMGLKGVAKKKMAAAHVPVLPGINEVEDDKIASQLEVIGYPVLIKPEAGGGGKGMKIVRNASELADSISSARREALSSFGNDALIAEKYLENPRHIEIQVFADASGNCIHLNERDCSLQRRHQKIVEEAPAPNLSDELRQQMGNAAINAAKAINYLGAGTIEFLLSENETFYFMEMNTRLQVEHPVTEMITGIDLVEWQLNIAMGSTLPLNQQQIGIDGHAVEIRLYAEDPILEFLPASGRIHHLSLPDNVRIDSGVVAGDSIGVFYDPMMMKVIAWSKTRTLAIEKLIAALRDLHVAGLKTNRDFLISLLQDEVFAAGQASTDYLDRMPDWEAPSEPEYHQAMSSAALFLLQSQANKTQTSPWSSAMNFRLNQANQRDLVFYIDDQAHKVTVLALSNKYHITSPLGESSHDPDEIVSVHSMDDRLTVFLSDRTIVLGVPGTSSKHDAASSNNVNAPMSGKVISLLVSEDSEVDAGTPLLVVEAMKMEHTICAPQKGMVHKIYYAENDTVNEGAELLDFEAEELA